MLELPETLNFDDHTSRARLEKSFVLVMGELETKSFQGTAGIMAHYELREEELKTKETKETLSEDERALLKMVHYISNFAPENWPLLSFEYWLDYRHKLSKDKRLQLILKGSREHSAISMDRHHRFEICHAEGADVEEHNGILHSAVVPEVSRVNFHSFAKPLFNLFELLGLADPEFTTDSIMIKMNSAPLQESMRECRTLLALNWSGQNLPENPTYPQLLQFLTNLLSVLIDGSLEKDKDKPTKKVATRTTVETADKRRKSGKTTRKQRERITGYKLNFVAPENPESEPYTALQRVEHLLPIQREDQD